MELMSKLIGDAPEFWRGVLASVAAAAIVAIIAFVWRILSATYREARANKRQALTILRERLTSPDASVRAEANMQLLFNVLKWLVIAGVFWFLPDTIYWFVEVEVVFVVRIGSVVAVFLALRWVLQYQSLPSPGAEDLAQIVTRSLYRLIFRPPNKSKPIKFELGGGITEGSNQNEARWRITNQCLEILNSEGKVYSRFRYDSRSRTFLHTNDPDTLSIRGQLIVPLSE